MSQWPGANGPLNVRQHRRGQSHFRSDENRDSPLERHIILEGAFGVKLDFLTTTDGDGIMVPKAAIALPNYLRFASMFNGHFALRK
jgi:hypothetical protein